MLDMDYNLFNLPFRSSVICREFAQPEPPHKKDARQSTVLLFCVLSRFLFIKPASENIYDRFSLERNLILLVSNYFFSSLNAKFCIKSYGFYVCAPFLYSSYILRVVCCVKNKTLHESIVI